MHQQQDESRKANALIDCAVILGVQMTDQRIDGYLRLLADVSAENLQLALDACMNDPANKGFFPRPAEIRAKIPSDQQSMLPADAAWSLALQSFDESESVVWTPEIEAARNVALVVWETGDKIGARMAFKGAYDNAIAAAAGASPQWKLSVGTNPERRQEAVKNAEAAGLIGRDQARHLLPDLSKPEGDMAAVAGLLTGNVVPFSGDKTGAQKLRESVNAGIRHAEERQAEEKAKRQQEADRKRERLDELTNLRVEPDTRL